MISLEVQPHPLLFLGAFVTELPPGVMASQALGPQLALDAPAPLARTEALRKAVRDLLRHGGYKPTGRGKPASEYLLRAAEEGSLTPINLAVDACNVVSLHSGFPISVVDLDRTAGPLSVAVAGAESYVFNAAGQSIDLRGLICLFDGEGPCANAVKDSQRTKTTEETRRTLSLVWAPESHRELAEGALAWYRALLEGQGATTHRIEPSGGAKG